MAQATAYGDIEAARAMRPDKLVAELSRPAFEALSLRVAEDELGKQDGPAQFQALGLAVKRALESYSTLVASKAKRRRVSTGKKARGFVKGTGYGGDNGSSKSLEKGTAAARSKERFSDAMVSAAVKGVTEKLREILDKPLESWAVGLGGLFQMKLDDIESAIVASTATKRTRKRVASASAKKAKGRSTSLVGLLRAFWRNDSVMDIGERLDLYTPLLELVELIARRAPVHSGLPGITVQEEETGDEETDEPSVATAEVPADRPTSSRARASLANDGKQAAAEAKSADEVDSEVTIVCETRTSLLDKADKFHMFSLLFRLNEQGRLLVAQLDGSLGADGESGSVREFLARLDQCLSDLSGVLRSSVYYRADAEDAGPVKKRQRRDLLRLSLGEGIDDAKLSHAYVEALKGLQLRSVSLLDIMTMSNKQKVQYAFAGELTSVAQNKARIVRIGKEMSTMATSLPLSWGSGIFLRSDESRPEVMSCLILGPDGTPYQNGAFVFDILLPSNYPQAPPRVLLKTTGHGSVRFNPNLYNCGKVCLSLLGTWSGPGWDPKNSTLLQVLVSIQSLIFVAEPYFNEPGYESTLGTVKGMEASASYNAVLRRGTMQFAILDQIKNPPYLFRDVLKLHFSLKDKEIRKQCAQWASEAKPQQQAKSFFPGFGFGGPNAVSENDRLDSLAKQVGEALSALNSPAPLGNSKASQNAIALDDQEDEVAILSQSSQSRPAAPIGSAEARPLSTASSSSSSGGGVVDLT